MSLFLSCSGVSYDSNNYNMITIILKSRTKCYGDKKGGSHSFCLLGDHIGFVLGRCSPVRSILVRGLEVCKHVRF